MKQNDRIHKLGNPSGIPLVLLFTLLTTYCIVTREMAFCNVIWEIISSANVELWKEPQRASAMHKERISVSVIIPRFTRRSANFVYGTIRLHACEWGDGKTAQIATEIERERERDYDPLKSEHKTTQDNSSNKLHEECKRNSNLLA